MKKCRFCGYPLKKFVLGDDEYYCKSCRENPIPLDHIRNIALCMNHNTKIKTLILLKKNDKLHFSELMKECNVNSASASFHINSMKQMGVLSNGKGIYMLTEKGKFVAELVYNLWMESIAKSEVKKDE